MRRMTDCGRTTSKWPHHNRVLKVAGTEIDCVAGSEHSLAAWRRRESGDPYQETEGKNETRSALASEGLLIMRDRHCPGPYHPRRVLDLRGWAAQSRGWS